MREVGECELPTSCPILRIFLLPHTIILCVFINFDKSLIDDSRHILMSSKCQDAEGSLNEKKAFADIAAGNNFRVDVD